jgi:hypothetical protein
MAAMALARLRRGDARVSSRSVLGMALLATIALCLYVVTPYSGDYGDTKGLLHESIGGSMRYAFPFCGLLAVLAGLGATVVPVPGWLLGGTAAVCALLPLLGMGPATAVPAALVGGLAVLATRSKQWRRRERQVRATALALAVLGMVALVPTSYAARTARDRKRERAYHRIPSFLAREVGAEETVGYFMCTSSYLFYGENLDTNVVYIPLTSRDSAEWVRYIESHGIDVIAMGPSGCQPDAWDAFDFFERGRMPVERVFGKDYYAMPYFYRLRADPQGEKKDG